MTKTLSRNSTEAQQAIMADLVREFKNIDPEVLLVVAFTHALLSGKKFDSLRDCSLEYLDDAAVIKSLMVGGYL